MSLGFLGKRPVRELVEPGLDVVRAAVLEIEVVGVLPDVGDEERLAAVRNRGVGVGGRLDLELAVEPLTSQAQPLPNWPTAAALKAALNLSRPPKLVVERTT